MMTSSEQAAHKSEHMLLRRIQNIFEASNIRNNHFNFGGADICNVFYANYDQRK